MRRIAKTAAVYPGTQLGADVEIGDFAVLGKQPTLGRRSTAAREELQPLIVGDGSRILAHAVVFAGSRIGSGAIIGDQACVRERCELGESVVVGRGAFVENDVVVGARTTNDNFMGRTERRHELRKGPTIRRGARIGGGAVLLPGIEIGEEAFVGAGAVVLDDVPARAVVVGNPARRIRDVPDDQLLPS